MHESLIKNAGRQEKLIEMEYESTKKRVYLNLEKFKEVLKFFNEERIIGFGVVKYVKDIESKKDGNGHLIAWNVANGKGLIKVEVKNYKPVRIIVKDTLAFSLPHEFFQQLEKAFYN